MMPVRLALFFPSALVRNHQMSRSFAKQLFMVSIMHMFDYANNMNISLQLKLEETKILKSFYHEIFSNR